MVDWSKKAQHFRGSEHQPSQRLPQMSLQGFICLFSDRNGQLVIGGQTLRIAVVADLSMGGPCTFGDTPFMMGCEGASFSHKTKRVLLGHPGKPLRYIWLKWKQTLLGTDHHIVSLPTILHARDDMNGIGRHFRFDGSRGCGLGSRLACPARFGRSHRDEELALFSSAAVGSAGGACTHRSTPACLRRGPGKNWANEAALSASLAALFFFLSVASSPDRLARGRETSSS
jgi:hypothetical protein